MVLSVRLSVPFVCHSKDVGQKRAGGGLQEQWILMFIKHGEKRKVIGKAQAELGEKGLNVE